MKGGGGECTDHSTTLQIMHAANKMKELDCKYCTVEFVAPLFPPSPIISRIGELLLQTTPLRPLK